MCSEITVSKDSFAELSLSAGTTATMRAEVVESVAVELLPLFFASPLIK
jgi:hypothetical protein